MASEFMDALSEVFSGSGEGISWSFDRENSYIEVAEAEEDLEAHDHAIRIVPDGTEIAGKKFNIAGLGGFGTQAIYLNENRLKYKDPIAVQQGNPLSKNWNARGITKSGKLIIKYLFAHEAGHTAYLPHTQEDPSKVGKDFIPKSYFANYRHSTGNGLFDGKTIMSNYENGLMSIAPVLTPRQIKVIVRRNNASMLNNGMQSIGEDYEGLVPDY
ncbi:MAG: hypothetical protein JJT94_14190 [Bernardetiaceae bacterium]|nr:hypothetical protein [Bernardetiaceae bacterium]